MRGSVPLWAPGGRILVPVIDKRIRPTTLALDLSGEWDLSRGEELQTLLRPAENVDELLLDLSKVTIVDASFLASLVMLVNRMVMRNRFGIIRIFGASPQIVRVFEACRLETLFDFRQSAVANSDAPQRLHARRGTFMERLSAAD